jgi:hypothetical protein
MRMPSAPSVWFGRMTASVAALTFVAACTSADRATGPSESSGHASADVYVPFVPIIPCVDSIFKGDFSADALNAFPGQPAIGSWSGNQLAGIVRVRSSVGWMFSKAVELTQYGGLTGGVGLMGRIRCNSAVSTGRAYVSWRSLVHSSTVFYGAVALRDDWSRILGMLEYRPGNVVTYNGIPVPGVTWSQDIPRRFLIVADLTNHRTSLFVDNVLKLTGIPYFESAAANLWRVNFEMGGTSAQSFAWDEVLVIRYS